MSVGRKPGVPNRPYDERIVRFLMNQGQGKNKLKYVETVLLATVTLARCLDISKRDLITCLEGYVDSVYEQH